MENELRDLLDNIIRFKLYPRYHETMSGDEIIIYEGDKEQWDYLTDKIIAFCAKYGIDIIR